MKGGPLPLDVEITLVSIPDLGSVSVLFVLNELNTENRTV